ncbi:MAG: TasA family protein [Candidatus Limnocylindrales bacterium]
MDAKHRTGTLAGRQRTFLGVGLIALVVVAIGGAAGSLARFTDSHDATGAFSTGTIILGVSPTTVFSVSNSFPGDSGSQTVNVSNTGSGELRYAISTSATNADGKGLATALQLTITEGTCAGSTVLYGPAALGAAFVGSATQGPDSGDRTLAAYTNEDLCFAWSLPFLTGNGLQGAATTATFTFAAEQTANNP